MRKSATGRTYRRHQFRVQLASPWRCCRWYCVGTLVLVLTAALAFVWLRSSHHGLGRELQSLRRDVAIKAKEVENLRMALASYKSGQYVLTAAEHLRLGLRPPLPGQVRRVRLGPPPREAEWLSDQMMASR